MVSVREAPGDAPGAVEYLVWALSAAGAVFGVWALHVGWDHSIIDLHPWRQTHTAISAYEIMRGGPFWTYRTPILGPPWTAPIELPLYQWMVGTIARGLSADLEIVGRTVAVAFFFGMLAALWSGLAILRVRPRHRPIFVALVVASPLYIFWSRTFMIESTALCFAVAYLAGVHQATRLDRLLARRVVWMLIAGGLGAVAGGVKVTTFAPWLAAAGLLVLFRWRQARPVRVEIATIGLVCFLLPAVAALAWLRFTDHVNAQNPLATHLAWSTVAWHHFGPLSLRLAWRSWYAVPSNHLLGRTRHAVIGSVPVFAAALALAATKKDRIAQCAACLAIYMLPIAVFMALYLAHVYYSYASGLFLLVALGCGIVAGLEGARSLQWTAVLLFGVALGVMSNNYVHGYYADQATDAGADSPLTARLRQLTGPDETLLLLGMDLVPQVPYVTKRRAIMDWENRGAGDPAMQHEIAALGAEGGRLGAMVVCGSVRALPIVRINIDRLSFFERPEFSTRDCDVYVARRSNLRGS